MSARFRQCFAMFVLIWSGVIAAPAAFAQTSYTFNLPEQSLADSLRAIGQQTEMNILFEPAAVKNARSPALKGQYTVDEAIRLVLAGTKLEAQHTAASNVVIKVKSARSTTLPATSADAPGNSGSTLAQTNSQSPQPQSATGPQNTDTSNSTSESSKKEGLSEIVVTGTLIHNVAPITPVITITQADLVSQGYTTVADAIYDLPQNFQGGGASPASNPVSGAGGSGASNNATFASGINLRGLGGSATLVLLNGRRLAPTAFGGAVDISQIPLSVIDRVEIVTDGASSLYGSDAVAGVVNIITKSDFSGVEVGGRSTGISGGKTPNYGGDLVGGTSWEGGGLVTSFDYEKDNSLWARNRSFSDTLPDPFALTPENEAAHYFASVHQNLTDRLNLSMDALLTHRTYNSTNNIFVTPVSSVNNGNVSQYSVSPQLDFAISSDWTASLIGQWSRERDHSVVDYPPPVNLLAVQPISYQVSYVEPRVDGKLFDLPGGGVRLAVGAQARQEKMDFSSSQLYQGVLSGSVADLSRHVTSAYSELMIPVIGTSNALPLTQELRVDVSVRYDHYSDFGSTTNPKVGISWAPVESVKLHGSYSRSFQAPALFDSAPLGGAAQVAPYVNPQSPTGSSLGLFTQIVTPLRPETARSYNLGLTLDPVDRLKIEVSYFDIDFSNEISYLLTEGICASFPCSLQDQAELGSFFQKNPSLAEVNAILNNPLNSIQNFAGANGSPGPYTPSDISAIGTLGNVNAGITRVRGVDLAPRYSGIDTSVGRFSADFDASYYLTYRQQITATSTPFSIDNTFGNPLRFRAKANVGWHWQGWAANARVNFANSYVNNTDPNCPGGCAVSSWTTVDTGLSYKFSTDSASWLRDTRFAVTVTNLFDRKPPYVYFPTFSGGNFGYDPVNANPLMRTVAVTFTKRFGAEVK
jgi:iron complex outermembrane recepter protein